MRQFIVDNQSVKDGLVVLIGKDFRYLRQVLRVKVGDMLNVRFSDGTLQGTTVASIDDNAKKIILQVCASMETSITRGVQADQIDDSFTKYKYVLFQFIPRPQKFEQIVRQATECGVSVIVPVIGEYSDKSSIASLQGAKRERLERIVKEARQQSGSPVDTRVEQPMTLEEAVEFWKEFCGGESKGEDDSACVTNGTCVTNDTCVTNGTCVTNPAPVTNVSTCVTTPASVTNSASLALVLSERTDDCVSLHQITENSSAIRNVAVAVGSEGGISPAEVSFLKEKGLFHPVHFAVNILRCETAALYGIAAIQTALN